MKNTQKTKQKTNGKSAQKIIDDYIGYVLQAGKQPPSVFKFCFDCGLSEDDFYKVAGSFEGLDRIIWKELIESVISKLSSDQAFSEFTSREQILSFYFALFERFKSDRSYILYKLGQRKIEVVPGYLKDFHKIFEEFFTQRVAEGRAKGEVATRPLIDTRYPQLFWIHFAFLLHFWKGDNSANFEQTDVAIEKSVNLTFDLIGKGAVDTAIDFARFMFQNKTN